MNGSFDNLLQTVQTVKEELRQLKNDPHFQAEVFGFLTSVSLALTTNPVLAECRIPR